MQHGQDVHMHAKRRHHLFGVVFVRAVWLEVHCRYLGMSNKVSMFFSVLFLLSYALTKSQSVLFN